MKSQGLMQKVKMKGQAQMNKIVQGFVAVLIGVVLTPIVATVVTDANLSGTTGTIITLIPVFFALTILIIVVRSIVGGR